MRRIVPTLAILALAVAACSPTLQERTQVVQQYVGKPEANLVQQMGVPDRVYQAGGIKFLAYDERRLGFAPAAYGGYGPFGGYAYGYAAFPPPQVERICESTFEITNGTVQRATLRGACGY